MLRIARIARPGAIYDASAAARNFPDGEGSIRWWEVEISPEMGKGDFQKERKNGFGRMPGFQKKYKRIAKMSIMRTFLGKTRKQAHRKHIYGSRFVISEKAIRKLKGRDIE